MKPNEKKPQILTLLITKTIPILSRQLSLYLFTMLMLHNENSAFKVNH